MLEKKTDEEIVYEVFHREKSREISSFSVWSSRPGSTAIVGCASQSDSHSHLTRWECASGRKARRKPLVHSFSEIELWHFECKFHKFIKHNFSKVLFRLFFVARFCREWTPVKTLPATVNGTQCTTTNKYTKHNVPRSILFDSWKWFPGEQRELKRNHIDHRQNALLSAGYFRFSSKRWLGF